MAAVSRLEHYGRVIVGWAQAAMSAVPLSKLFKNRNCFPKNVWGTLKGTADLCITAKPPWQYGSVFKRSTGALTATQSTVWLTSVHVSVKHTASAVRNRSFTCVCLSELYPPTLQVQISTDNRLAFPGYWQLRCVGYDVWWSAVSSIGRCVVRGWSRDFAFCKGM